MTGANANDGCQTEDVLRALVIAPPVAESAEPGCDSRDFPRVQADGAYGNGPTQERAERAHLLGSPMTRYGKPTLTVRGTPGRAALSAAW